MSFENNELTKTIISGGIGYEEVTDLGDIILQKEYNNIDDKDQHLFSSYVIDSSTLTPINKAYVYIYEGDQYFPNTYNTLDDSLYSSINEEFLYDSAITDNEGYFVIKKALNKQKYTLLVTKSNYFCYIGYINNNDTILSIPLTSNFKTNKNKAQSYKIVLEWPNAPNDLNIYSFFKVKKNDQCEVFFGNKNCKHVIMDTDNYNNGTQGTQTIIIDKLGEYIYTFAVNQFEINDNPKLRGENKVKGADNKAPEPRYPEFIRKYEENNDNNKFTASVKIYQNNMKREIYKLDVNTSSKLKWWKVFCINGKEGISSLKTTNKISGNDPTFEECEELYNK